ncbi:MAG: tetratricopeptide repeat protein [Candidatus Cloacimonetes bacterium]|nr:tetratricopeptide repeat protein [Candidatus Cloacimonadota bacterium]
MFHYLKGIRAELYRKRGQRLLVKGINDQAVKCFRKALSLSENPENVFNLGLGLLSAMELEEAEGYLSQVVEEFPEHEISVLTYFEVLILQEKWQAAIEQIEKLCQQYPENIRYKEFCAMASDVVGREKYRHEKILSHEAYQFMRQRKYGEALEKYIAALEYLPEDLELINNIGYIHLILNEYTQAYSYFEKALQLDPGNRKVRQNMAVVKNKLRK